MAAGEGASLFVASTFLFVMAGALERPEQVERRWTRLQAMCCLAAPALKSLIGALQMAHLKTKQTGRKCRKLERGIHGTGEHAPWMFVLCYAVIVSCGACLRSQSHGEREPPHERRGAGPGRGRGRPLPYDDYAPPGVAPRRGPPGMGVSDMAPAMQQVGAGPMGPMPGPGPMGAA